MSTEKKTLLTEYSDFVEQITSDPSNHNDKFQERWDELLQKTRQYKTNLPLLLTASQGLSSESGEFTEIVKKCLFQNKPYDENTRWHLVRELGDIFWYLVNACRALGYTPEEVIKINIDKLKARYPTSRFETYFSENRKEGDL